MATSRVNKWGGLNTSDEEQRVLDAAYGMLRDEVKDAPDLLRKCVAIALPVFLQNPLLCRVVDLKDTVRAWDKRSG